MKTQPDFICPGMQKAGTTWLFRNLNDHPGIWLPPIKEIHYFDEFHNDPLWWKRRVEASEKRLAAEVNKPVINPKKHQDKIAFWTHMGQKEISDGWYQKIWQIVQSKQIMGDITPDYSVLRREGVKHVKELCPNAKIIFLLRDPVDRTWSAARMWANETGKSPEACYKADFILARSDYKTALTNWMEFYPDTQISIFFYEDIVLHPDNVMRDVCQILDIHHEPSMFRHLSEPVHVGKKSDMPDDILYFYRAHFRENIAFFAEKVGGYAEQWFDRHYGRATSGKSSGLLDGRTR